MKPLSIRLTPRQIAWLDDRRAEGEPRSMVVRRLLGELMAGEVERTTGSVGAQANQ
jgi:Arc/MetJ-type ribon-helix-helix transcriptional regulator